VVPFKILVAFVKRLVALFTERKAINASLLALSGGIIHYTSCRSTEIEKGKRERLFPLFPRTLIH
jgi:hypothetical protein